MMLSQGVFTYFSDTLLRCFTEKEYSDLRQKKNTFEVHEWNKNILDVMCFEEQ